MMTSSIWTRWAASICLAFVLPSATLVAQEAAPLRTDDDSAALAADLDSFIPALMERAHVPGLSVAVVRGSRVVWDGAYGVKNVETREPVTRDTRFEAASLTKPLFAYAMLRLVDAGVLDLDTPLVSYLPKERVEGFITHPLDREGFHRDWLERITARHVLSHSSGMPHGERPNPLYPLFFEPGTQFKYSAAGYYLLQLVAEHRTGDLLQVIVQAHVFDPLGMQHSSMVWHDDLEHQSAQGHGLLGTPEAFRMYRRAHAAASMYTTAVDYARFVTAVLNREGLSAPTMRVMLEPAIEVDEHDFWSLGFGIQRDGNGDAFWQWGDYGIFRNFVIAYPDAQTAVVYLTNSYYGLSIGPEMVRRTVGGETHALDYLGYTPYDAPATQLTWLVLEHGAEAAVERVPELRAHEPEALGENDINRLGYGLLNAGRHDDAIVLFELNVREHPRSANTYDSLAEGFQTRGGEGDLERAIRFYRKSLEAIPNDPRPDKDFLAQLKANAEQRIPQLEQMLRERKGR